MTFQVSRVAGAPNFESLPVAKVINYPLEKRDYKPFAQNRICVGDRELFLRMWAFEVSPDPASELRCVLYLFPDDPEQAVCVSLTPPPEGLSADGRNRASVVLLHGGRELEDTRRDAGEWSRDYNGEDLQGVYWGATVSIPLEYLAQLGEMTALAPGDRFPGNFFKLCTQGCFSHKGCFYPADFRKNGAAFALESMGLFEMVAY